MYNLGNFVWLKMFYSSVFFRLNSRPPKFCQLSVYLMNYVFKVYSILTIVNLKLFSLNSLAFQLHIKKSILFFFSFLGRACVRFLD